MGPKKKRSRSRGEDVLAAQLAEAGIAARREFRFAPPRRFRFDFAIPELMISAEVEGGTWAAGRHTRGSGFEDDCIKYNLASLKGWSVFRFTTRQVSRGEAIMMIALAVKKKTKVGCG